MINRNQWVRVLHALPSEQFISLSRDLTSDCRVRPKSIPQSGLGMLKLNDAAYEKPFYLGEFPLSSAWVEIETTDGIKAEGAAQVMDDRVEVAESLALCDAILSNKLPGWEQLDELLEQGMRNIQESIRERNTMLDITRVDFSLLDDVGDNDA